MDSTYSQLNFSLNLDLDKNAQKEIKANGTNKLYKLYIAKKFKHIIFGLFILEVGNGLLL